MKRFTPILLASFLLLTIFAVDGYAQPAPTIFPPIESFGEGLAEEYWDTLTVDSIAVDAFSRQMWYVTVGLLDTTDTDTFYMYPNSGSSDWPIRLYGPLQPNKFHLPQLWSFGPLKISTLTVWGWYGAMASGANPDDSTQIIWIHAYPVPTGY